MSRLKGRPKVVDQIADFLIWRAVFSLILTIPVTSVWLLALLNVGMERMLTELGQLTFGTLFLVCLSIFLFVLARDIRRMKKWAYRYAEFICTWSMFTWATKSVKKAWQKELQDAFGQQDPEG